MLKSCNSFKDLNSSFVNSYRNNLSDDNNKPSTSNNNSKKLTKVEMLTPIEEDCDEVFTSRHHLLLSGDYTNSQRTRWTWKPSFNFIKITVMVVIWIICSCTLMMKNEKIHHKYHLSIPTNKTKGYIVSEPMISENILISLEGAFLPPYYANLSSHTMHVWVQLIKTSFHPKNISSLKTTDILLEKNISDIWKVPIVSGKLIGIVPEVIHKKVYQLYNVSNRENYSHYYLRVKLKTNVNANVPVSLSYNVEPINKDYGIIYAAVLLFLLYFMMIFEIVHRALAAMLVSTIAIAILAALNDRPTMEEIISWIDVETLLLLFSMMVMVAIFTETGIFDYMSVLAYKLTGGKIWPLINTLCIFTALLSCFLDNVTTALLMTPVTIRLCEVMKLNPVPVLINMIVYSNIGGALTPIGDPPNVIIASNADVLKAGITFSTFTLHMSVGVFLSLIVVHFQLRFMYRDTSKLKCSEPNDVQDLKREIAVWQRTAASLSSYSKEEEVVKDSLMKRISRLLGKLDSPGNVPENVLLDQQKINIKNFEDKYPIKDKPLLIKCAFTLFFVITVFFLQTIPPLSKLGLGWTALLGTLLLLILSDRDDIEAILARVEWSTLLFFASLFILMEALSRLGLIEWIGQQTNAIVMSVGQDMRLSVAILLILWVSAIASAFVDNIPLTTMMIRIATSLADNRELNLPLQPLIWALSFGACLGGNGTLFGSSSNIICAGVAEQHGYRFSFLEFMKVGFPVMISSMLVTTVYLLVAHVAFTWH